MIWWSTSRRRRIEKVGHYLHCDALSIVLIFIYLVKEYAEHAEARTLLEKCVEFERTNAALLRRGV